MESIQIVRDKVSSIMEVDFFLNEAALNEQNYKDDRIAQIINGTAYKRAKQRIDDFRARKYKELERYKQDRVDKAEAVYDSLVKQAKSADPGSGFWVSKTDHSAVDKYNNKLELYRRICDKADDAKGRYENAVDEYNAKKSEIEDEIREKMEDLKPALDQDIITLLKQLQDHVSDSNKEQNQLECFLLGYLAKRAHVFLFDRIENKTEQRIATDVIKKIDDEMEKMLASDGAEVKQVLHEAAAFVHKCHQTNNEIHQGIHARLQTLPYQHCKDTEAEVQQFLDFSDDTSFAYKHIIDPVKLAEMEEKVQNRKTEIQKQIELLDEFSAKLDPTFDLIAGIRDFAHQELAKMRSNKTDVLDPGQDSFTLGIFDEEDQERYLKKHRQWLKQVQNEIEQALSVNLYDLLQTVAETELGTKAVNETLAANEALLFHSNQEKLSQQKQKLLNAINAIDSVLNEISALPRKKAREFAEKMSNLLNAALVPLLNVIMLFMIQGMIKEYLPALKSPNTAYVDLKKSLISKYKTYFYVQCGLALASVIAAIFVNSAWYLFVGIAVTYAVTASVLFAKGKQLESLN